MTGDVAAAVDHPAAGGDAEVSVLYRPIPGHLRGVAPHIEAVVRSADREVVPQEAAVVLLIDQEAIVAAPLHPVSADDVVGAADRGPLDAEADARPAGAERRGCG